MGAGKISGIYLENGATFDDLEVVACADLLVERAEEQAREYGVPKAYTPEELLAEPEVEIVLNLTVPRSTRRSRWRRWRPASTSTRRSRSPLAARTGERCWRWRLSGGY